MTRIGRDLPAFQACCIDAVRAAGQHAVKHKPRRVEIHERFSHDVKLKLDHECQAVATDVVLSRYPDDRILGEEGSQTGQGNAPEWIIDPIDGTVNFFHGLPWWCNSVAVRIDGRVVAGAVYAAELNMMFAAVDDGAAELNGETLSLRSSIRLADALVITGSEKELAPDSLPMATAQRIAPHVQKIRIMGAAALDICQVASGAADAFYQVGLYIWDVAAAGLIVERAGGIYRQRTTEVPGRYACLAASHAALASALEQVV